MLTWLESGRVRIRPGYIWLQIHLSMLTLFSLLLVPSGLMAGFVGFQGNHFIIMAFLEAVGREKPSFLLFLLPWPLTTMHTHVGYASLDMVLALLHRLLGSCYVVVMPTLQPQVQHRSLHGGVPPHVPVLLNSVEHTAC